MNALGVKCTIWNPKDLFMSVFFALLGRVINLVGGRIYKSLPVRLPVRVKQFDL